MPMGCMQVYEMHAYGRCRPVRCTPVRCTPMRYTSIREIYLRATMFTRETYLPEKHAYQRNILLAYISLERSYLCVSHRACISEVYISWADTGCEHLMKAYISWGVHAMGRASHRRVSFTG